MLIAARSSTRIASRLFPSRVFPLSHRFLTSSTPLEKIISDTITATGPISFSTYIHLCLSHPIHGYYSRPPDRVFGKTGDFVTSPEISQVFGELVAVWLLQQWMNAGSPPPIRLVELGPGRGTLMSDIVRVVQRITRSEKIIKTVYLVETSASMREAQRNTLEGKTGSGKLIWCDTVEDIPVVESALSENETQGSGGVYTMVVAHEFFDALPIHILRRTEKGWNEVLINNNTPSPIEPSSLASPSPSTTTTTATPTHPPSRFHRTLSPTPSATSRILSAASPRFAALPVGSQIEVSPASFEIARRLGNLLTGPSGDGGRGGGGGGCALIIDYGGDKVFGDSFRAFKDHRQVDVFDSPGRCDLTSNVDFALLKEALRSDNNNDDGGGMIIRERRHQGEQTTTTQTQVLVSKTYGPISQSEFLKRMGLELRVDALVKKAWSSASASSTTSGSTSGLDLNPTTTTEARRARKVVEVENSIRDAARRLVDGSGMGKEYQVLGVVAAGAAAAAVAAPRGGGRGADGVAATAATEGKAEEAVTVWPF